MQGIPKQFNRAVKLKLIRMFVSGFCFQFLRYMQQQQKNCRVELLRQTWVLFVALSHCNKQIQYMLPNYAKKNTQKNTHKKLNCPKIHKKCQKEPQSAKKKLSIVDTFGNSLATYTNFICCSDSVRQQFFVCLLQWFSETN